MKGEAESMGTQSEHVSIKLAADVNRVGAEEAEWVSYQSFVLSEKNGYASINLANRERD